MGDSGEGLVDAEARTQERMEELQRERERKGGRVIRDPELHRALESLKMARSDLARQLDTTKHERRKTQLMQAIEEVDRRIAELNARTPRE